MALSKEEMLDLRYAHSLLEEPGLSTKITGALGVPVEKGFDLLPRGWRDRIATCLLYTSPSPRDGLLSRMPSSA